jgi:hypothetical protein
MQLCWQFVICYAELLIARRHPATFPRLYA